MRSGFCVKFFPAIGVVTTIIFLLGDCIKSEKKLTEFENNGTASCTGMFSIKSKKINP